SCFSKERSKNEQDRYRFSPQAAQTNWRCDMSEGIINSSGNVFLDLGYAPEEAAILQMRADLMADLRNFIEAKRLTQAKAAELLGITQSRVSDLTRGKWEKFNLEMLITLATKAGMHVTLKTAA
ncbi:MAG TPA: XRE family transcriptional regulator, partial [Smithellaceae bacterium]|nr:XRE family transcriptional regulator [Smithellaceae bacterium]